MDLTTIAKVKEDGVKALEKASSLKEIQGVYNFYLAKKGAFQPLLVVLKDLSSEEKSQYGKALNEAKTLLSELYKKRLKDFEKTALEEKLAQEKIDLSLPGRDYKSGHRNPFWLIVDEVSDIFLSMGFEIAEGSDYETDHANFELLNIPPDHPSRDMQDTFYFDAVHLLRTQTSAAQAHEMQKRLDKGPIRIISPGKCYRRDDDDMTHSHQFGQIEGLVIGKGISMADLKGTLDVFAKRMFGAKREIRLRSSYFPFTEPSVEVDVSCAKCGGKGCNMCHGSGWIEILGAGEVHPNVLRMGGYDPDLVSGFAFGVGIERVAMLRYGIDDIRRFYQNDVRFISGFEGEERRNGR